MISILSIWLERVGQLARRNFAFQVCGAWIAFAMLAVLARADDWPHWMGPTRDNVWREEGLLQKFPAGGPPVVWRTPIAGGYAGPAVAGGYVYVMDYIRAKNGKLKDFDSQAFSGVERVLCLEETTGRQKWKFEYPVKYGIAYPAGPRCTPIVHQNKVYTLGAEGNLICLDAESGVVVWSKDLPKQYNTQAAMWGYAAHPRIDGQKLISLVGGAGSHVVAFDKETGEEIWRSLTATEQGYSPPTILEAGGTRQLILVRPDAISSVNPETGKEYWSVPYEATAGSVIMSPIHWQDYLYVGGYNNKSLLMKLASDRPGAEIVWGDKPRHGISPVNVQPFLDGDTLYGFHQNGMMFALEMPSGKRLWETALPIGKRRVASGTAFIVKQSNRYWMFNERGELLIAKLSPKGFEEVDRCSLIEPTNVAFGRDVVWCMPAFANKRMYVRNDKECICVDLAELQ